MGVSEQITENLKAFASREQQGAVPTGSVDYADLSPAAIAALNDTFGQHAAGFARPVNDVPSTLLYNGNAVGVDGTRIFFVTAGSPGGLFESTDYGVTATSNRTYPSGPSYQYVKKIVRFGAHLYCAGVTGSLITIWRTTPNYGDSAATYTWTQVFQASAGTNDILPTCLTTDGVNLYVGEYGDPTGGPQVWRSPDGTTWTSVDGPVSGNRHCHGVFADPYEPGHVWATYGDGGTIYVRRSTDYGATWATVVSRATATDTWPQVVQLSFDEQRVWGASDQPSMTAWTIRKDDLILRNACTNYHADIPVPSASPRNGASRFADLATTAGSKTITCASGDFTTAMDRGRRVQSQQFPNRPVYITGVTNSTTLVVSENASFTGTGKTLLLGPDRFPDVCMFGAVDPTTGIWVGVAHDPTLSEVLRTGIFYIPRDRGRVELWHELAPNNGQPYNYEMFIVGGYAIWSRYVMKLPTRP